MGEAKNIYFTCLKGNFKKIFKGLEKVNKSCSKKKSENADLRENVDGEDHHPRGRTLRFHRECQGQDPGQRGHSARSAASDLRGQAVGRRPHFVRLQHPEGVDAPLGAASPRRHHRAVSPHVGSEVQLREDDLPQMLRQAPAQSHELPQAQLWTHRQPPPQEEAQVKQWKNQDPRLIAYGATESLSSSLEDIFHLFDVASLILEREKELFKRNAFLFIVIIRT